MTITAVCLTTCFIAMKYEPFIYHNITSMQHKLDQDIEVRVQILRSFQKTTKWNYEKDLRLTLEKAVADRVNPTLAKIQNQINDGTYGESAKACFNTLEHEMLKVTRNYFAPLMMPCIYEFRRYIVNSLVGIPELLDTFHDLRIRMYEIIDSCDRHLVVRDPADCVKEEQANIRVEALELLETAEAFTNDAAYLYALANGRFAHCMKHAGLQLQNATLNMTNNGTRCLRS